MKIVAIILQVLLFTILVNILHSIYLVTCTANYYVFDKEVYNSMVSSTFTYVISDIVFLFAAIYTALRKYYLVSIFISAAFILLYLAAIYVFNFKYLYF